MDDATNTSWQKDGPPKSGTWKIVKQGGIGIAGVRNVAIPISCGRSRSRTSIVADPHLGISTVAITTVASAIDAFVDHSRPSTPPGFIGHDKEW
jgi:hypothetical protein